MINSLTLLFQFLLNEPDLLSEHLFKFMKTFQIFFCLTVLYTFPKKVHLLIKCGMRKSHSLKVKPLSRGNANTRTPEFLYE